MYTLLLTLARCNSVATKGLAQPGRSILRPYLHRGLSDQRESCPGSFAVLRLTFHQ